MSRDFEGSKVRQLSKSGFMCATDITEIYNKSRVMQGLNPKELKKYFQNKSTIEFMEALCKELNLKSSELKLVKRGKGNKGTWLHPLLFLDYVKWLTNTGGDLELNKRIMDFSYSICGQPITMLTSREEHVFAEYLLSFIGDDTKVIRQFPVGKYRLDFYLPEHNLAIEYDEQHHVIGSNRKKDIKRQSVITSMLECHFIRVIPSKKGEALKDIGRFIESSKHLKSAKNRASLLVNQHQQLLDLLFSK